MTILLPDSSTESPQEVDAPAEGVYVFPASPAQQRLWLVDQLEPGSPLYNIPLALRLVGRLDAGALEAALGEIVARHETLRTTLALENGEVVQVVAQPPAAWPLPRIDLSGIGSGRAREAELRRRLTKEAGRPFDLLHGPLFRTLLLRLGDEEHVLALALHHTVADGWSMGVLLRELAALYRGELLSELPIQYADFVVWQRDELTAEVLGQHLAWWRERLEGAPAVLDLPLARARPSVRSTRGVWRSFPLPAEVTQSLRALCRREGATPFLALFAAFQVLLHRWTGQQGFLVGTPLAGRSQVETEGLIGLFANLVPLRANLEGTPGFREVVRRVRETFLGADAHQDLPFERLVEELQPVRSTGHAPLVQAIFTFQQVARPDGWPGLCVQPLEVHHGEVKFDLALSIEEGSGGWVARLAAAADLLEPVDLLRLLASYGALLAGIAADPAQPIGFLPVEADPARHQALHEWNDTASGFPRATIGDLFADQVTATPEAIALESEGEVRTYRELAARANRLAHHLIALGVGPEVRVGLCLNRSMEAIEAILAILKAGGVYVPLEPAYPRERLALMIEDAAAPVVVTASVHLSSLPEDLAATLVVLDRDREEIASRSAATPASNVLPDSLAYVVYTSGSTGRPKGVAVPHRAVVRLVRRNRFARLSADETWLQLAPIVFDASTLEIWGSLLNGARLVVFPGYKPSLEEIGETIERSGVTSLWLTAGLFHQMADGPLESLRGVHQLLAGGDVLSVPHVEKVLARFPDLLLVNGYGPTENTTFTCCHRMRGPVSGGSFAGPVPIGRPIAATRVVLLDPRLEPVPSGAAGELYAGGEGLARGYLGRPDLTAERFVPNPLAEEPGARLYRTGDLARWLPDGVLEFLGRADFQVKIRGFRIEPGEVEAALCAHPEVRSAFVAVRQSFLDEKQPGEKWLVAYVVPAVPADARSWLAERLPDYMVPAAFVGMEALPLDPNGKVDRRALPAPEAPRGADSADAPVTLAEELLAGIWAEVLRLERVGVRDNFFDLGGHSLLATQVMSRVGEVFGVELPLRRLFEAPTVAELAHEVEVVHRAEVDPEPSIVPRSRAGDPPASFAQERLWFLEQLGEGGTAWNLPLALRLHGTLDTSALEAAWNEVVRRHETLRTHFRSEGEQVLQVIASHASRPLPKIDLYGLPDPAEEARRVARREAGRPFALDQGPLARALLLELGEDDHELVLVLHHILADGWSLGVLLRELSDLYEAFVVGQPAPLPALPVQYADFAVWQREWLLGEVLERQLSWWRERLAGAPATLELPADRPRPAVWTARGGRLPVDLEGDTSRGIHALARKSGSTPFMVLLAAFQSLLARYAGSDDAPVGSPIANRNRAETEGLIGFFINTLVLRTDLGGTPRFTELVRRVREGTLEAYARQDLPFEKLVEELRPERVLSRSPLFQVMLVLQNAPLPVSAFPSLEWELAELAAEEPEAKLDLTLALSAGSQGFHGQLEYGRDLFDEVTALRIAGHFRTLLAAAVADPDRPVVDLELLTPEEQSQLVGRLLGGWNDTAFPGTRACLHELVAAQAARTPESLALAGSGARLTYGDLMRRVRPWANRLRRLGVGPEVPVGVALERTPDLVVALLAVLEAGGVYVPLDPGYPQERLAFLLADAQAGQERPVLLTESRVLDRLPPFTGILMLIDQEADSLAEESDAPPDSGVTPGNLAYLIYTSGSTGRPKGVAIEHRSAAALLDWAAGVFPPEDLAGMLASTSVTFDLSVFELFLPLTRGGTVLLAANALELPHLPAAGDVRLVNTVPSAAAALVRSGGFPPGVRTVNLAGEPLKRALVDLLYATPGVERVFNLYGPSEDTTYSTWVLVPKDSGNEPTIGVPIANTRAYILDSALRLLPVGVPGELFLGGEGLARGYLHRPDLTADRFVPDPFGGDGERLYRTGDRVRRRPDGELEFLGRLDHQVKIRGFRIEPGEIETALLALPGVRDAVVLVREDPPGDLRLVAYVAPVPPDFSAVRERLRQRLPEHMIPAAFIGLDALPLTPNGKVDRKALPAPDRPEAAESAAPRTPAEDLLAGLFAEVLGRERAGIHDSFFDLGGHSLLATRVVSRVRELFGVDLPLRRLFETPTVAALAERVEAARRDRTLPPPPPVRPIPRGGDLPASFAQERLWFLEQMGSEGAAYHLPVALRLRGPLAPAALAAALGEIVRRHEALRTTFRVDGGRVLQVISPPVPVPLPVIDLAGVPGQDASHAVASALREPFDLQRGPLLRALLIRRAAEEHDLLLTLHHVVSDGWSNGLLVRELGILYEAFAAGRPSPLPDLAIQYPDFAVWQREWLRGEVLEAQLAVWRQRLAGAPPVLELPADHRRPAVRTTRGGRVRLPLDRDLTRDLRTLARRSGVTPFMVLLATFQTLLARWAGREDILVGSPVANRNRVETEELIGLFVNTLVLRTGLEGEPRFGEVLRRVREVTLEAYDHQDIPFEKLVEELRPERALGHAPLFQVMLILQNLPPAPPAPPGLEIGPSPLLEREETAARFDLTLALAEEPGEAGIRGEMETSRDLFDATTAHRMAGHFRTLLAAALADPGRRIADLEVLSAVEQSQLLRQWNDTAAPGLRACLHELVAAQAERSPSAVAVVGSGERLSYRDLLRKARRLAHRLRALGVGPEVRVGVALERTPDLVAALLAVLEAGGAYVPLDPGYPPERLAFLLADSQAGQETKVLLSESRVLDRLPPFAGTVLRLDAEAASLAEESEAPPDSGVTPENLAYLIYTSGSTGRPKGVAIEHRSAAALLEWAAGVFPPEDLAGVLASTSITFDLSVFELFLPLTRGGTVLLAANALELPDLPAAGEVRLVNSVPSAAAALVRAGGLPPGVRTINLAGEPLKRALVDLLYANPGVERVFNLYGPSEDTTYSTWGLISRGDPREPSIGVPIANTRAYVLDSALRPLPAGVPGELFLAGEGLARGYLHRPELTADRFVPDPFGAPGERLYRTGDRVRWRPDGELEFLGRLDDQVKIRGFRIEPGEIEAALLALPGVRDVVVMAREDVSGDRQLVAYVAPEPPDLAALRESLRERLPEHMLPAAFVGLAALPLTPNGKVDRKALPAPEQSATGEASAPRNPMEELLAGIFAEVLGRERIGLHDSFFELGGHSLLATRVTSRMREVFAVDLPLRRLFEAPTVAGLAVCVETTRRESDGTGAPPLERVPRDRPLPASFSQERLWFLDRFGAGGIPYLLPNVLRLRGPLAAPLLHAALDAIVQRHEVLRTAFALEGNQVVQVVIPGLRLPLPVVDLTALPVSAREAAAAALIREEARRPFDLSCPPLVRTTLLRREPEDHDLLLTLHHIVSDGWSNSVLIRELGALMASRPLLALPVQYGDFAAWQRGWLRGEVLDRQIAWWRDRLAGVPAVLELPTDRPRPAVLGSRGARQHLDLPPRLATALRTLGRRQGATLFMALLGAFQTLLARWAGCSDLCVGSPVAGRNRIETEGLIGLFVNTLVLRSDLAGTPSFAALLDRVREATLDAWAHQDVPFEKLVEELSPQRDTSHTPLFQVLMMLQNTPGGTVELPELEITAREVDNGTAKLDLVLALAELEDGRLAAGVEHNRDLFDPPTIARLLASFATLLEGAAADPSLPWMELPLLPDESRQQILREWNDTAGPSPGRCLHQPFEEWAARTPEALAVVAADERLTYGELDKKANRLAWCLRALGVGPGSLVAVYLDRGAGMITAVLAVHKAGGAYVPVETSWPAERVHGILAGQEIAHVVTSAARHAAIESMPPLPRLDHLVCLEEDLTHLPETAPPAAAGPDDLAYIIFTSGSTGRPKGVVVQHRPALNLIDWVNETFAVGPGDLLLFVTNLSFDLSVYDIFGTLAAGAAVHIASAAEQRDPQALARLLCREPVTFWDSAPAALQALVPWLPPPGSLPDAPALRLVFLSGDWIPVPLPDQVRGSFPRAQVVSLGGATEATIWSNFHRIGKVDPAWASILYGRPIRNARYHVLDAAFSPCPVQVAGDLHIGGECLSAGYAGDPAMTAESYLPDPFGGAPGARLYRTGDRARYGANGNLEFLGRHDTQVKVRGFRIELGEIEAVLSAHPGVREAVVLAREDRPGDQRLVAYVLPALDPPPTPLDLRRFAQRKLPEYMLPSAFLLRASWPLSATGKLDRKALPAPEAAGAEPAPESSSFEAPRTGLERTIAAIWCEAIGLERVGVRESFFDAGGHSLLMARVHARLEEALARPIPLVDLFQHPTIEALARALAPAEGSGAVVEERPRPTVRPETSGQAGLSVALIGLAGRFPGARDVDELWRNLCGEVESIRFFADEELLAAGFPAHLLADPRLVKARGALDSPDLFDAAFFDIPPREAQILDPQQRLFLECAWEALEHAGWGAAAHRPRVGVFAGATENTYVHHLLADPDLLRTLGRQQISIANNHDYLPTRVSYKLDLRGPSVNVQTACSTSLTAVHLACLSLLRGECEMALAGGVSVQAQEVSGYLYQEGGISSPDGHTRTFDARARGVVGGSGAGVVLLKRLEDALADGDTIHAVLRGTASNNDGAAKVGFTAPSVEGQAAAIREALRAAGVRPAEIDYVEAHGTGTPLGDPIEIKALVQAFQSPGEEAVRCTLGSIKSNIGHLDAASGVSGLIKTALALREGTIPASLHFERPNPEIDFGPFSVNAQTVAWPKHEDRPRRAGVSSFGIGGTNAHAVLEEAPAPPPSDPPRRTTHLLVLSARTPAALEAVTARLADHLETRPGMTDCALADLAFTLQVGRQAFRHRRTLVCRDREDALTLLRTVDPERVESGEPMAGERTVAFLFPGQGAQYPRMGEELYRTEPAFRTALDQCCDLLAPDLGLDLRVILFPPDGGEEDAAWRLEQTALTQPALFAVEYALARLWMEWGLRPAALLGHSIGEYVAACLAGVFSLEDALGLIAARGRLMQDLPPGAMLAVALTEEEALAAIGGDPDLGLAAVSSTRACVISGSSEAIEALRVRLEERGLEPRRLHTSHAFHSAMMEPALEPFAARVRQVQLQPPRIPFLSNVTGRWIRPEEATDPGYWARHLRAPVRFADGLAELLRQPGPILLEVGPGRTLATLARQHAGRQAARRIVSSLGGARNRRPDAETLLATLGKLWLDGVEIDWSGFHAGERRRRVPLPTYPFERRSFWIGPAQRPALPARETAVPSTPSLPSVLGPVEQAIAGAFRDLLGVDAVAAHDDFFELGGSSLMAVQLGSRLRDLLELDLPSGFLLETSTVRDLAALVESRRGEGTAAAPPLSCLVRLQAGTAGRRPLFLVHQVGGHVFTFRPLARSLGADQPFYGLRSQGLEGDEEPFSRIEEMAEHYLGLVRGVQPSGPYRIGGASMGGMVAFEMAHQLRTAGEEVELLVLMDTPCLDQMAPRPTEDGEFVAAVFAGRARLSPEELRPLSLEEQLALAGERVRQADPAGGLDPAEARRLFRVLRGNVGALYEYTPRPYPGRMLYFRAEQRRPIDPLRPEIPWIELARGGVEILLVPGDHQTMHEPPHVQAMADRLKPGLV